MQQFVIPQFIDVEDKIIGPITTRQFVILLVVAGLIFISYRLSDFSLFVLLTLLLLVIGIIIAFVRVNGRPFHFFLLNLVQTMRRPGLRVWKKKASFEEISASMRLTTPTVVKTAIVKKQPLASSKLSELALVVDTGGVYHEEN